MKAIDGECIFPEAKMNFGLRYMARRTFRARVVSHYRWLLRMGMGNIE